MTLSSNKLFDLIEWIEEHQISDARIFNAVYYLKMEEAQRISKAGLGSELSYLLQQLSYKEILERLK